MEQLTKTRFQNLVVNHKVRVGDNEFDPNDVYILRIKGDSLFDGHVQIKKDLIIDGSLTVLGKSSKIMTEEKIIGDNTIIINATLNDLDLDFERESGIIIMRPLKNGIHQEPFKIVYKDVTENGIDHNDILDIGISGELHRVATINDYPTNMGVPMWNDASGILDTETNITVERHSIGGDTPETSQNLHVRNGTIFNTGRDRQHYDIDLLYQPPPKFIFDSSNTTTSRITVNWRKEHVIKRLSFMNDEAPFINTIAVDIQQISPPERATDWINATTAHIKDALSYTFKYSIKIPITNGIESLYIDKDCSYNVRVYGLNFVEQTPDNYLFIENLFLKPAGVPNPPTSIQFDVPTLESIHLLFNAPSDNDLLTEDIQDLPIIMDYTYTYEPIDSGTIRYPSHTHKEQSYSIVYETIEEEQFLNHPMTINIINNSETPIHVGTAYKLSTLKARNEINPNYSENGVIEDIITITDIPNTNEYYITPTPSVSTIVSIPLSVYNPAKSAIINVSYYNIYGTQNTPSNFTTTPEIASFFVNNGRLGKTSTNQLLAYAKSYYNLDTNITGSDGTYISDTTISYKGYYNTSTDGTIIVSPSTYATYDQIQCLDAKKPEYNENYNGFALYGTYKVKPTGINTGFVPSQNIYAIKYTIENKGGINGLTNISQIGNNLEVNQTHIHPFIVDDLNNPPTISNIVITTNISSVLFSHGIPSIQDMLINMSYNINHIGSQFLPSNRIISVITPSNKINGVSTNNVIVNTIPADKKSDVIREYNTSISTVATTNLIDLDTITNIISLKPINLLYSQEAVVNVSLKENNNSTNKFWFDVKSFSSSSNKISSLNAIGTDVYQYNINNKYVLTAYNDQSSSISYNQLLYVNGGFTTNPEYYKNYSIGYIYSGLNYATIPNTGDVEEGKTYKWLIKKLTTTSNAGSTQYKRLSLSIDGANYTLNNISSIPSDIRIMTVQLFTNGNTHTKWLNARKEFNSDIASLNTEDNGNLTSVGGTSYLVYKDLINTTFDFYVRIGLPIGTSFSITNISFANR